MNQMSAKMAGIHNKEIGWSLQVSDGSYVGACEFLQLDARSAFFKIAEQLNRTETENYYYLVWLIQYRDKYLFITPGNNNRKFPLFAHALFLNLNLIY
jgi:hypothetical protein